MRRSNGNYAGKSGADEKKRYKNKILLYHDCKNRYRHRDKQSTRGKKEGIEFKRCGITLYAYQRECNFPVCYIIDPETGLSIDTVNYPLSVAHRHISRNAIKALKQAKEDCGNEKYKRQKKEFIEADRAEVLED